MNQYGRPLDVSGSSEFERCRFQVLFFYCVMNERYFLFIAVGIFLEPNLILILLIMFDFVFRMIFFHLMFQAVALRNFIESNYFRQLTEIADQQVMDCQIIILSKTNL